MDDFAHSASLVEAAPQRRHSAGAVGEQNSGSGSTRIVALVSSFTFASHSAEPHHPA